MKKRKKKPVIGGFARKKTIRLNLVQSLFVHGKLETSQTKAKQLSRLVDVLIVKAKGNELTAIRLIEARVGDFKQAKKIYVYGKAALVKRQSGFCSLKKIGFRRGDNQERARIELIDFVKPVKAKIKKAVKTPVVKNKKSEVKEK